MPFSTAPIFQLLNSSSQQPPAAAAAATTTTSQTPTTQSNHHPHDSTTSTPQQHPTPPPTRTMATIQPIRPPTTNVNDNSLPAILCLHGNGSNSIVFKLQCRRLLWALGSHFRFVFVEAPHEGPAGYGMLPTFESCAPFYRWVTRAWAEHDAVETLSAADVESIDDVLVNAMIENGGVESFVGVLGFSQGARVASGLLLRQQMAERDGQECWTRFKFAVMVGGPHPPIVLSTAEGEVLPERDYALLTTVPTVSAWGAEDVYKAAISKLADLFQGDKSYRLEFDGGHHMPLNDGGARRLCEYFLEAAKAAGVLEAQVQLK